MIQIGLVNQQIVSTTRWREVAQSSALFKSISDVSDRTLVTNTLSMTSRTCQRSNETSDFKVVGQLWLRVYENHSTLSLCLICCLKAPIKQNFWPWPASRPLPSQALQLNLSEIAKGDKRVCCLTMSWQGKSQTKRFRNGKRTFYYVLTIWCPKDKRVYGLDCVLVILFFHAFDCRNVLIHNYYLCR